MDLNFDIDFIDNKVTFCINVKVDDFVLHINVFKDKKNKIKLTTAIKKQNLCINQVAR